jgi:uncharacterized membrane protein HdeD (DUF308 family)
MRAASTKPEKPVDPVRVRRHMGWLHHTSLFMVLIGVALIVVAAASGFGPTATLVGMMLIVAGVVKVVVVRLWHGMFAEVLHSTPASERSEHE